MRRTDALDYIASRIVAGSGSPSFTEIAAALHVSPSRAKSLVSQLVREGAIQRVPGSQRAIAVRDDAALRRAVLRYTRLVAVVHHVPLADQNDRDRGGVGEA